MSEMEESAKAMADIAKFGTASVEASVKLGSFLAKVLGEPFQDSVGLLGDRLKLYRFQNQVVIMNKVEKILEKRGTNETRPIPPKFAIPIMEYASLEEDESLQDIWCRLLANGLDPTRNFEFKYVYIDIIKSLTPLDARVLKYINEYINKEVSGMVGVINLPDIQVGFKEICKEFPDAGWPINASLRNLMRVHCIEDRGLFEAIYNGRVGSRSIRVNQAFTLTSLGMDFISSCMKD